MRKTVLIGFLLLAPALSSAEPQMLFTKDMHHGWYVGPAFKLCVEDPSFNFFGIKAGWIVNHRFTLGAAAFTMTREPFVGDADNLRYSFNYGGLLAELEPNPDKLIHLNYQVLIGGGAFSYFIRRAGYWYDDDDHDNRIEVESDAFFVVEPGVNVILNLTKHARCGAGLSYRLVDGVNSHGFTNEDAEGLKVHIFCKFGSF